MTAYLSAIVVMSYVRFLDLLIEVPSSCTPSAS